LTDIAVLPDMRARHNMTEVPDFGSSANFSTRIDDAGLMHEVIAHLSPV
jgi:hypothetical protein